MGDPDWFSKGKSEKIEWKGKPKLNSIYPVIVLGLVFIPVAGLGLLIIAFAYLSVKNTDYVISNQAIYKKTGIFSREVKKIGYEKIQDTSYRQGLFGRYFEYGNVMISTAGGQNVEMNLRAVDNPRNVRKLIDENTDSKKEEQTTKEEDNILSELKEIKEEVRKINSKLE